MSIMSAGKTFDGHDTVKALHTFGALDENGRKVTIQQNSFGIVDSSEIFSDKNGERQYVHFEVNGRKTACVLFPTDRLERA